jgi:hypothetical protein
MAAKLDDRSRVGAPKAFVPGDVAAHHERHAGDTLPPTPLAALAAAGGADLVVLSTDAQLLDTVTRATRDQIPVWPVASWTELETALAVTRRAVVLVDAELLGKTTGNRIAALDAYSHKAVTLVAADRSIAQGLMGLLSEGKVHRLLIKPPALGITRLLIDSAVGRCMRLADVPEAVQPLVAEQPPPVPRREAAAVPFSILATAGAALVIGVIVIATVSARWRSDEDVPPAARPPSLAVAIEDNAATSDDVGLDRPHDDLEHDLVAVAANSSDVADSGLADAAVALRYAEAESALLVNDFAAAAARPPGRRCARSRRRAAPAAPPARAGPPASG